MKHLVRNALASQRWAIKADHLPLLAAIAERDHSEVHRIASELGRPRFVIGSDAPQSLNLRGGQPFGYSGGAFVRDGVAVIGLDGPLFPKANMMTQMSGATSLDMVAADYQAALDDDGVRSIILAANSPGGVVGGPGEFARAIASRESEKPVWTYVSGLCCSAMYWIASATDRIVSAEDGLIGSIGVVVLAESQEKPDAQGYRQYEIVSSNAGNKRPDPSTDEGRAEIVRELDEIEAVFHADVASGRGVSVETVRSDFGQGGVFAGAEALARGMIDEIGSLETVLARLAGASTGVTAGIQPGPRSIENGHAAAGARQNEDSSMSNLKDVTVATLRTERPDLVAAISEEAAATAMDGMVSVADRDAAVKEAADGAVSSERQRVAAIDEVAIPGHEALVAEMKADGTSADDAARKLLAAEKTKRDAALDGLKNDDPGPEAPSQTTTPDGFEIISDKPKASDAAASEQDDRAIWESDQSIRTEFGSFEAFTAYQKANRGGQVRVLKKSA